MAMTHLKRKGDWEKLHTFPTIRKKKATVSFEEKFNNLDW